MCLSGLSDYIIVLVFSSIIFNVFTNYFAHWKWTYLKYFCHKFYLLHSMMINPIRAYFLDADWALGWGVDCSCIILLTQFLYDFLLLSILTRHLITCMVHGNICIFQPLTLLILSPRHFHSSLRKNEKVFYFWKMGKKRKSDNNEKLNINFLKFYKHIK